MFLFSSQAHGHAQINDRKDQDDREEDQYHCQNGQHVDILSHGPEEHEEADGQQQHGQAIDAAEQNPAAVDMRFFQAGEAVGGVGIEQVIPAAPISCMPIMQPESMISSVASKSSFSWNGSPT